MAKIWKLNDSKNPQHKTKDFVLYESGYYIQISSWENDLDNEKTVTRGPFPYKIVQAIHAMFYPLSKSDHEGEDWYGNICDGILDEYLKYITPLVFDIFKENDERYANWIKVNSHDKYYMENLLHNYLFDFGLCSEHFSTRVMSDFKCFFIPEKVVATEIITLT